MKKVVLIVFCFHVLITNAQEMYTTFNEQFIDNKNNWPADDDEKRTFKISGGFYILENHQNYGGSQATKWIDVSTEENFKIETLIKKVSGTKKNMFGLQFGRMDNGNQYQFYISGNGYYQIRKFKNGMLTDIKSWTKSRAINKGNGSSNHLSLMKDGSQLKYYINNKLVHTGDFEPFVGRNIGFFVYKNQKIAVDYLKISTSSNAFTDKNSNVSNQLPPILAISDITFSENILDANETAKLSITLKNAGPGIANNVYINLTGYLKGLSFPSKTLFPTLAANGGTASITIDIKGDLDLPTSEALIKIEVVEPNFKVKIQGKQLRFSTRKFRNPELILAQYVVLENQSSSPNGQIDINEMVDLKFTVQNIGQGNAENVNINVLNNQNGVMFLGVKKESQLVRGNASFSEMQSGKHETITYQYFINSEFTDDQLEFTIESIDEIGKYGFSETKSFNINRQVEESGYIRTVDNTADNVPGEVIIEDIPDLISDVDRNIPLNKSINENSFALVIGNENYNTEVSVPYAINDASIFRKYALNVLGIPKKQIHYVRNASYGQILNEINWINNVIQVYDGKAKVYFYYAGHGIPDASNKSAYILPVDGNASNTRSSIVLSDIYKSLEEHPSQGVYVFLDACFSGSSRNGMLTAGRGVSIKPKKDVLRKNIVVFSAASGDETAHPFEEQSHGLFTYFLLKKLQETKGEVTLKELADYIQLHVSQKSAVENKPQHPNVNFGFEVKDSWQGFTLK